ncbi:MAG TPA: Uma2 family endonuclease [Myxococcaceae bacterium]
MEPLGFESVRYVTPEEFRGFVEERERAGDVNGYELLNGRVVMNPPAGWPHGAVGSTIQWLLNDRVRRNNLGLVFDSSQGFHLPSGDVVEPDHSFVSNERLRALTPKAGEFLQVVPDLVAEVLSGSNAGRDRGEKKGIYERNGVREYWLVDPRARTLIAFALASGRYGPADPLTEDNRYRSPVLGLEFEVKTLFPELPR